MRSISRQAANLAGAILITTCCVGIGLAADQATIDAAKKEGELIHTDNFFAPDSVARFHAAFRKKYGLPESFKIRQNTFNSSAVV